MSEKKSHYFFAESVSRKAATTKVTHENSRPNDEAVILICCYVARLKKRLYPETLQSSEEGV